MELCWPSSSFHSALRVLYAAPQVLPGSDPTAAWLATVFACVVWVVTVDLFVARE
jgi:hypothetical protein